MFKHLKKVNQNYIEHFTDAFKYSFMALQASIYFLSIPYGQIFTSLMDQRKYMIYTTL
jgi:hypothetical protein